MELEYYDEVGPFTREDWDSVVEMLGHGLGEPGNGPFPGDGLYIGDDDDGNPIYVEIAPDVTPMFMGEANGCQVWAT